MRGEKELHNITPKNMPTLFSKDQLNILKIRGMTLEGYSHYRNLGVDVKRCPLCVDWGHLKTLIFMTTGLTTSCSPCEFKQKTI